MNQEYNDNVRLKTGQACGVISLIILLLVLFIITCMSAACTAVDKVSQPRHPRYEPTKERHQAGYPFSKAAQ